MKAYFTPTLQKSRMLELRDGKGEAVLILPRTLDNKGDAASPTFPKGKKHGTLSSYFGIHLWLLPGKVAQFTKNLAIIAFTNPVTCFLCNVGVYCTCWLLFCSITFMGPILPPVRPSSKFYSTEIKEHLSDKFF